MKCTILHEGRGRMRVHVCNVRMTLHRADVLEAYLNHHDAIEKATVYEHLYRQALGGGGSPERLPVRPA